MRNYAGWHVTADADGCASLLALLDELAASDGPNTRVLSVESPTPAILSVPNNRSGASLSPSRLRLTLSANPSEWTFPESLEPATLTFGVDWLPKLRQGIADIALGNGDYSIGNADEGNLQLWFWWQPATSV